MAATKHDQGKPGMHLIPGEALNEIAKVLDFGAKKYSAHNWRQGFKWSRLAGAAMRHIVAWIGGEDKDPESRLSHLAHACCCLMMLLAHEENLYGEDDRYKKPVNKTLTECQGIQYGDTMVCPNCQTEWSTDDPYTPLCKKHENKPSNK